MRFGILGTADVAFRRFLPALLKCPYSEYVGVATRTPKKGMPFMENFGGKVYCGYDALLKDGNIDAVYVPLPPALHFEWGKKVLQSGKHLFMEKPFTISLSETEELMILAEWKGLAIYENYMFLCHRQFGTIKSLLTTKALGELRILRISFGFPKRSENDFRYNRALGGSALLDCGGYTIRLATEILGQSAGVMQAKIEIPSSYEVDLFGSAVLKNEKGLCAQISFGMDNAYQCQLEIWGSKATLIAPRIFTAGTDMAPKIELHYSSKNEIIDVPADDQFLHSIQKFERVCVEADLQRQVRNEIRIQAELMDAVLQLGR